MTQLAFVVLGPPVPKARPRVYGKRTITEPRTVAYESLVRSHAIRAVQLAKRGGTTWDPAAPSFRVVLEFFVPNLRRADVDNLAKSCLDALNGVIYLDDFAVCDLHVTRVVDREKPRVVVYVSTEPA